MKRLVLKELREQLALIVSGLGIFTVMLVLAFQSSRSQAMQAVGGYGSADGLQPLLATSLLTQAAFFCAIFGALLGCLQIQSEKHPDLWAFLVHRPIQPMTILWSKVFSGLMLYLAGAGLPIMGLILVVSTPGQVAAPFAWPMALPLVTILLGGAVFYGGGLLTGLRKARWYVSRVCGLGPPVLAMLGALVVPEFWHALLILALAGGMTALAVWGSFRTRGHYHGQPAPGKFALTLTATASALLVVGLVAATVTNLFWASGFGFAQYQVTTDGEIIRLAHVAMEEVVITDLAGRPVLDPSTGQRLDMKAVQKRFAQGMQASVVLPDQPGRRGPWAGYAQPSRFFLPWSVADKALWYLRSDGRLVAFHGMSRRQTAQLEPPDGAGVAGGLAGESGFIRSSTGYWNFQPYESPNVMASAAGAFLVDLQKREVRPLFRTEPGDPILGYSANMSHLNPGSNQVLIVSRTSIRVLDFAGRTRLQVSYDPAPPDFPLVTVFTLGAAKSYLVRFDPDYQLNRKSGGRLLTQVKWVNADGNIDRAQDLPKLPEPSRDRSIENCLLTLMPPGITLFLSQDGEQLTLFPLLAAATICGLIGLWLARRNHFTLLATLGWTVFHLLFGLAGLLAFLAVQEWPAREPCPGCRRLRVVNRERCEHCDAAFAPPPRNGIEIFEPLVTP